MHIGFQKLVETVLLERKKKSKKEEHKKGKRKITKGPFKGFWGMGYWGHYNQDGNGEEASGDSGGE